MFRPSLSIQKIYSQYVDKLYLKVLHGNFLRENPESYTVFMDDSQRVLEDIKDKEIISMYNCDSWREQLVASWICGLGVFKQHRDFIGDLLLQSKTCYAGQMHCFALARFADKQSVHYLVRYLKRYLPIEMREYDQKWAIGALAWLDNYLQLSEASQFLSSRELWLVSYGEKIIGEFDPWKTIDQFKNIMAAVEVLFPHNK